MLKLSRKIRKKILTENTSSKYFKYAIGEIILVVIGILIALHLNNLNRQNTIQKQQENHLKLVRGEMISNIHAIAKERKKLNQTLTGVRKLLNTSASDTNIAEFSENELSQAIASAVKNDMFIQYENGVLSQVIFSGGLKDIENDSIRTRLASLEGWIHKIRLQEEEVNELIENIKFLLAKYGDTRTVIEEIGLIKTIGLDPRTNRGSNKGLLELREFKNMLVELALSGSGLQDDYYSNFEKDLLSLVALIKDELNIK